MTSDEFRELAHNVRARVPIMDDHRQVKLNGQFKLEREGAVLGGRGCLVPVVVEADLTDGDDFVVSGQIAQPVDPVVAPGRGRVGMHADRGIDAGESFGQGQHGRGVVQIERGNEGARHARCGCALHDFGHVVMERLEVEMAMSVEESDERRVTSNEFRVRNTRRRSRRVVSRRSSVVRHSSFVTVKLLVHESCHKVVGNLHGHDFTTGAEFVVGEKLDGDDDLATLKFLHPPSQLKWPVDRRRLQVIDVE